MVQCANQKIKRGAGMNETKIIKIITTELLGADTAISTEDGDRLFQRIDKALANNALVHIDFKNIKLMTTAFFECGNRPTLWQI